MVHAHFHQGEVHQPRLWPGRVHLLDQVQTSHVMTPLRIPRAHEIPILQEHIIEQIPLSHLREVGVLLLGLHGPDGIESLLARGGDVCLVEFEVELIRHLGGIGLGHEIFNRHDVCGVVGLPEGIDDRPVAVCVLETDSLAGCVDHSAIVVVLCRFYNGRCDGDGGDNGDQGQDGEQEKILEQHLDGGGMVG